MGSDVAKLKGYVGRGGEVPAFNPHELTIIGLDEAVSEETWWAYDPEDRLTEDLDSAFVDSIRAEGVRDPIQCRRDGDRLIVYEGRRRTRAARKVWDEQKRKGVPAADRIFVRAIIRKIDHDAAWRANLEGNLLRKALSPLQRAQLMAHRLKWLPGSDTENRAVLAREFHLTVETVRYTLGILDLAPDVQRAIGAGRLPVLAVRTLAKLPRGEQKEKMGELIAAGANRGEAARQALQKVRKGEKVEPVARMRSRTFLEGWRKGLATEGFRSATATDGRDAKIAMAVLAYALGDDDALDGLPVLRRALEQAEKPEEGRSGVNTNA